jgi:hypothetical protein
VDDALSQFKADLERVGMRVVPHRNHLCVRLPLFASVRVHVRDGELDLVLQAGPTRPGRALAWTAAAGTAIVGALGAIVGVGPVMVTAAFGGLALLGVELGQLIIAEGCATRLAMRWAARSLSGAEKYLSSG